MGGGDHNAGIGAQAAGDISDTGCRQRTDKENIDAHGQNAGRDGVFEHVTGEARVLADDNFVAAAIARLGSDVFEDVAGGATELEGGFGGDRFDVGGTPNTVGAEYFPGLTHRLLLGSVVVEGFRGRNPLDGDFLGHDPDGDHVRGSMDDDPFLKVCFVFHVGKINKGLHV